MATTRLQDESMFDMQTKLNGPCQALAIVSTPKKDTSLAVSGAIFCIFKTCGLEQEFI